MSISKREIKLLLSVGIAAVLALVYFFGYAPLQNNVNELKAQYTTIQTVYNADQDRIKKLSAQQKQLEEITASMKDLAGYYYGMTDQEEYIVKIISLATDSGITLTSISHPGEDVNIVSSEETDEKAKADPESTIGYKSVYSVEFDCTSEELTKLLNIIDKNRALVCNSLKIDLKTIPEDGGWNQDKSNLKCTIELAFYYLTDLEEFTNNEGSFFS